MTKTGQENGSQKNDHLSRVRNTGQRSRSSSISRTSSLVRSSIQSTQNQPLLGVTFNDTRQEQPEPILSIVRHETQNPTFSPNTPMEIVSSQLIEPGSGNSSENEQSSSDNRNPKRKTASIKENFEINGNIAVCKKCNEPVKFSDYSSNNLRTHLYYKHGSPLDILTPGQKKKAESLNKNKSKIPTLAKSEIKKLNESVYDCIIKDSRSFMDLRKPGILKFIQQMKPGYKPPARQTVERHLKKKFFFNFYMQRFLIIKNKILKRYSVFRKKLILLAEKVKHISITCDLWKNKKNRYFLAITGHFFDKKLKFHSIILSFRTFNMRHFAVNIQMAIKDDLKKLGLDKKCVSVTTDNESCMVKGCSSLFTQSFRISCLCHNLNLIVINTLKLWNRLISIKYKTFN